MTATKGPPNYWDYLKLDRLLALQGGLEEDESQLLSDELHFIVVHQVFELWFKLTLRELRLARDHLSGDPVPEEAIPYVVHHLRRVNAIVSLTVDQFGIMETLTPQDFLAFRDKLVPASGFQSFQMRELEVLLGLDDAQRIAIGGLDSHAPIKEAARAKAPGADLAWNRVQAARGEESLRAALHRWLHRTPIRGSSPEQPGDAAVVDGFLTDYLAAFERLDTDHAADMAAALGEDVATVRGRIEENQRVARRFLFAEDVEDAEERPRTKRIRAALVFIESYRTLPLLAWPRVLVDTIVELEEQLVLFRTRHARMVERMIGRRIGTGGSTGVDYLDRTTRYRSFPELWAVRTVLLPVEALPPLPNPEAYGFAR